MLDGFLISAGVRTQSVIAQSLCEAEYIAPTAATSEAKYIQALFLGLWTTREHPSAFRQLWRHRFGKQKRSSTVTSSGRAISVVAGGDRQQEHSNQQGCLVLRTWLTVTRKLQTNVRSSSADQRWASQRSRNSSVMQFCNKFITIFLSLCHRS